MEDFEELGLSPETVEALTSEGVERPTGLQAEAVPVIRRGNNLVAVGGPGAGTLIMWAAPLLERVEAGGSGPRILVATPTAEAADRGAESLARLARGTGHAVAALGSPWVLPERAHVLFGTPSTLLDAVRGSRVALEQVEAVVVDAAAQILELAGPDDLEALLASIPAEAQRVLVTLPLTTELEDVAERHLKRAVHLPPRPAAGREPGSRPPRRGDIRFRIVREPLEEGALALVAELLGQGEVRHVCLFVRSDDRAADLGDLLGLHGFAASRPGDDQVPVWLAVDELEARKALDAAPGDDGAVVAVSVDVPADPDSLDRRHGGGRGGTVLVAPREVAHLRDVARRTGYRPVPSPAPSPPATDELQRLLERVEETLERPGTAAYLAALAPLLERHAPEELAAAAVLLLREGAPGAGEPAAPAGPSSPDPAAAPVDWVRLYVSLGERDGIGPGDLVGAITGEAGIDGGRVGRIGIRENFSIVEVDRRVADQVIRSLNGVTVRGRAVRADYDRESRSGSRRRTTRRKGG